MANTSDIRSMQETINRLLEQKMDAASKYYSSGNSNQPSSTALSANRDVLALDKQIRQTQNAIGKERWYGSSSEKDIDASTATQPKGVMAGIVKGIVEPFKFGLKALQTPLTATVGVAEWASGKGTKDDLVGNVVSNVQEGETWGDYLRKSGASNSVSMPLGFAMDLALDPLNWLTAGTAALVPRVATGLVKGAVREGAEGALKGVMTGAGSNLASKASKVTKLASTKADAFGVRTLSEKLGAYAVKSGDEYNAIIGKNVDKTLDNILLSRNKYNVVDKVREFANENKVGFDKVEKFSDIGTNLKKFMGLSTKEKLASLWRGIDYNPNGYLDEAKARDKVIVAARNQGFLVSTGDNIDDAMNVARNADLNSRNIDSFDAWANQVNSNQIPAFESVPFRQKAFVAKDMGDASDIMKMQVPASGIIAKDGNDLARRVAEEINNNEIQADFIAKAVKEAEEKFGFKASEVFADHAKDFKITNTDLATKTMESFEKLYGLFKMNKISTPGSFVNAIFGNPTMYLISGGKIANPDYLASVMAAKIFVSGRKSDDFLMAFIKNQEWQDLWAKSPNLMDEVLGVNSDLMVNKYLIDSGMARGQMSKISMMKKYGKDIPAEEMAAIDAIEAIQNKSVDKAFTKFWKAEVSPTTHNQRMAERVARQVDDVANAGRVVGESGAGTALRPVRPQGIPSSFLTPNEIYTSGGIGNTIANIAEKAKGSDWKAKLLYKPADAYFNIIKKAMSQYESIDQSFKLGTVHLLTNKGIGLDELESLARFHNIDRAKDIVRGADGLYKIKPERALHIVSDIYMNYGAMPAAVRALRNLPILGSPFVSFSYAMAAKGVKALRYNPAAFNKWEFLQKELRGGASPLEKDAINNTDYYKNLNNQGVVRLPFFDSSPVYLNLANMVPYYTMNMFNQSQRDLSKYSGIWGNAVNVLDRSPLMKTPEGQLMFDYLIQPMLIKEGNPVGSFDNPLYPNDATLKEKVGYAARSYAESYAPSAIGGAGLMGVVTENLAPGSTQYVPNYYFRKISYATQGANAQGTPDYPDNKRGSRTFKAISGFLGFPVSNVNLTYNQK